MGRSEKRMALKNFKDMNYSNYMNFGLNCRNKNKEDILISTVKNCAGSEI